VEVITLIHRYLGETLVALVLIGLLLALGAKDPAGGLRRGALGVGRILVMLLSLQWLLGIINFFSLPAEVRPGWGHPVIMTLVVALGHMAMGRARKDPKASHWRLALIFAVLAVLMIYAWRLA